MITSSLSKASNSTLAWTDTNSWPNLVTLRSTNDWLAFRKRWRSIITTCQELIKERCYLQMTSLSLENNYKCTSMTWESLTNLLSSRMERKWSTSSKLKSTKSTLIDQVQDYPSYQWLFYCLISTCQSWMVSTHPKSFKISSITSTRS